MIMERVKTDDAIPYWDYDAPVTEETPRDASAAAVTAAGTQRKEISGLCRKNSEKPFKRRIPCQSRRKPGIHLNALCRIIA